MVHSNIYHNEELLECTKVSAVEKQSYRIYMTQDSYKISERSPGKDPILIMWQKLKGLEPDP